MRKRFGRVLPAVLVGAVAVAVVLIGAVYFRFISLRIYEDSTGHLEEIYGQVNRTFGAFLDRNWGLLDSCNEYFTLVSEADDRVVSDFVARKKEYWRFSDFYFLSTADQTCLTAGGKDAGILLDGAWEDLADPVMAGSKLPRAPAPT